MGAATALGTFALDARYVLRRLARSPGFSAAAEVNGQTGILTRVDGRVFSVTSMATDGERILAVYNMLNPDKLTWPDAAVTTLPPDVSR